MPCNITGRPSPATEYNYKSLAASLLLGLAAWLVGTNLEVLASLERQLHLVFAFLAFHSERDLLCGLGLLLEHWLCLTTVTLLLPIVILCMLRAFGSLSAIAGQAVGVQCARFPLCC